LERGTLPREPWRICDSLVLSTHDSPLDVPQELYRLLIDAAALYSGGRVRVLEYKCIIIPGARLGTSP